MKVNDKHTSTALGLSFTMLIMSLTACDQGIGPDTKTTITGDTPGYDAGYEFGFKLALLRQQQPGIKLDEAFKGMLDALSETSQQISDIEMCAKIQSAEHTESAATYQANVTPTPARINSPKDDYAALNARREGVVTLPSSVQYEILQPGNGRQPVATDTIVVNYKASLTNGTVFDSTYEDGEAATIALEEIAVPGLREALLLMQEGAQWRVVVPPRMGFGKTGKKRLRRRDLIYEIELLSVASPEPDFKQ